MFHEGYNLRAIYYETGEVNDPGRGRIRLPPAPVRRACHCPEPASGAPASTVWIDSRAGTNALPGSPAHQLFSEISCALFHVLGLATAALRLALFDDSDDALMPVLDVSVRGLKKLWRGIYERIEDRMPEFFGDTASGDEQAQPGKRRQVLAYVRQRREELRPWCGAAENRHSAGSKSR